MSLLEYGMDDIFYKIMWYDGIYHISIYFSDRFLIDTMDRLGVQ